MDQINQMNMIQKNNQIIQMNQMNLNNNINQMNNMNQMNQINLMNPMNQMNLMNQMNPMNQMNLMNQIYPMNQMNLMNQMNPTNNTNPLNQTNAMNNMNPLNPMNNMNQMNQINEMNQLIQMNNMNQMNLMNNMNPLNPMNNMNQMNQINPMNNMNQMNEIFLQICQLFQNNMNALSQMMMGYKKNEEEEIYEDIYSELKEPKKCLYFIRNEDGKRFRIKIPCSLKNDELYPTAEEFKLYKYSDLKLFHKNKYLKEDETPIDYISDGDEINIIEEFHDININKTILICFDLPQGSKKFMRFTLDTTVKEMIKMFFFENRIPEKGKKNFRLLYNGQALDFKDILTLGEKAIVDLAIIKVIKLNDIFSYKGKRIESTIFNKGEKILNFKFGTLNTIKQFYDYLENNLPSNLKIQKLEIGEQELKKDDKRTFSSIRIRNNFICNIDLINTLE